MIRILTTGRACSTHLLRLTNHLSMPVHRSLFLASLLAISGCAFNQQPYPTYENKLQPLPETSVFSQDFASEPGTYIHSTITHVDGKEMPSFEVGYPVWVRVLPGTHVFKTRHCTSVLVGVIIQTNCALRTITVEDMKAKHVYAFNRVSGQTRDLGANPDFAIELGRPGARKKYPVRFE